MEHNKGFEFPLNRSDMTNLAKLLAQLEELKFDKNRLRIWQEAFFHDALDLYRGADLGCSDNLVVCVNAWLSTFMQEKAIVIDSVTPREYALHRLLVTIQNIYPANTEPFRDLEVYIEKLKQPPPKELKLDAGTTTHVVASSKSIRIEPRRRLMSGILPLQPKKVFHGYRLLKLLYEHTYSQVWEVQREHDQSGNVYALKLLFYRPNQAYEAMRANQFTQEQKLACSNMTKQQAHLAYGYEAGEIVYSRPWSAKYLLMKKFNQGNIIDYINHHQVNEIELFVLLNEVAQALDYLHNNRWIHCDIKPSNILVHTSQARGTYAALSDFGIAYRQGSSRPNLNQGTVPFKAPEISQGSVPTPANDIHAFGMMCFILLNYRSTYKYVYKRESILETIANDEPRLRLREIYNKALHNNPKERYSSASEFLKDLQNDYDLRSPSSPIRRVSRPVNPPEKEVNTQELPYDLAIDIRLSPDSPDINPYILFRRGTPISGHILMADLPPLYLEGKEPEICLQFRYRYDDAWYPVSKIWLPATQNQVLKAVCHLSVDNDIQSPQIKVLYRNEFYSPLDNQDNDPHLFRNVKRKFQIAFLLDGSLPKNKFEEARKYIEETSGALDASLPGLVEFALVVYGEYRDRPSSWGVEQDWLPADYDVRWIDFNQPFITHLYHNRIAALEQNNSYCGALEYGLHTIGESLSWEDNTIRHIILIGFDPPHPTAQDWDKYELHPLAFPIDQWPQHPYDWRYELSQLEEQSNQSNSTLYISSVYVEYALGLHPYERGILEKYRDEIWGPKGFGRYDRRQDLYNPSALVNKIRRTQASYREYSHDQQIFLRPL